MMIASLRVIKGNMYVLILQTLSCKVNYNHVAFTRRTQRSRSSSGLSVLIKYLFLIRQINGMLNGARLLQ